MNKLKFVLVVSLFCVSTIFAQTEKPKIVNGGVLNGKAVSLAKPEYPPAAKAVNAAGTVNVSIKIDEKGDVIFADAVSGHALLRKASEEAALASKFSPTFLSGKAVTVSGVLVYNFIGTKETESTESNNDKVINGGVVNGKAISLPKPKYPAAAKAVKASGAVNVQVTIDENGEVIAATAVSGHALLRSAAESAALGAKFSPTFLSGQPVKIRGVIVYNFLLPKKKSK